MELDNVLSRFLLLSGLSSEEGEGWKDICSEAMNYIDSLLINKSSLSTSDVSRLTAAAGALSFYKYASIVNMDCPESFSAGDLRIDNANIAGNAEKLWNDARREISDLTIDEGFMFSSVRVQE